LRIDNGSVFYTANIVQAGAFQNVQPSRYDNTNVFYSPTVVQVGGVQTLLPAIFVNANTFYSVVISQPLPPTAEADIFVEIRSFTERRRF